LFQPTRLRSRSVALLAAGVVIGLLLAGTPALASGGDLAAKALAIAKKADKRSKEALAQSGRPGPQGPAGPAGPAVLPKVLVARVAGDTPILADTAANPAAAPTVVATLNLPAASYQLTVSATAVGQANLTCAVVADGVAQLQASPFAAEAGVSARLPMAVTGPVTVSGGTPVVLSCTKFTGTGSLRNTVVTAVPVSEVVPVPAA